MKNYIKNHKKNHLKNNQASREKLTFTVILFKGTKNLQIVLKSKISRQVKLKSSHPKFKGLKKLYVSLLHQSNFKDHFGRAIAVKNHQKKHQKSQHKKSPENSTARSTIKIVQKKGKINPLKRHKSYLKLVQCSLETEEDYYRYF